MILVALSFSSIVILILVNASTKSLSIKPFILFINCYHNQYKLIFTSYANSDSLVLWHNDPKILLIEIRTSSLGLLLFHDAFSHFIWNWLSFKLTKKFVVENLGMGGGRGGTIFVIPDRSKTFRWNFPSVQQIYRDNFWK